MAVVPEVVVVSEDRAEQLERDRAERDALRDIERAEREQERDEAAAIRALEWAEAKRRWRERRRERWRRLLGSE